MKISFVTSNAHKFHEVEGILRGFPIELERVEVELPEIQALTIEEVATEKVRRAYDWVKGPVVVDDSGVIIEAWNGLPGAFTSYFVKQLGLKGIVTMLKGFKSKKATAVGCVAYHDGRDVEIFSGKVQGQIIGSLRGDSGFGYDPIFIPDGHDKTFAELSKDEKNKISHRSLAFRQFGAYIQKTQMTQGKR